MLTHGFCHPPSLLFSLPVPCQSLHLTAVLEGIAGRFSATLRHRRTTSVKRDVRRCGTQEASGRCRVSFVDCAVMGGRYASFVFLRRPAVVGEQWFSCHHYYGFLVHQQAPRLVVVSLASHD